MHERPFTAFSVIIERGSHPTRSPLRIPQIFSNVPVVQLDKTTLCEGVARGANPLRNTMTHDVIASIEGFELSRLGAEPSESIFNADYVQIAGHLLGMEEQQGASP